MPALQEIDVMPLTRRKLMSVLELPSKNQKRGRQTEVRQSPISTIRTPTEIQHRLPECLQNQQPNSASTDSQLQWIKEKNRYGISVSTPHRRFGHRLRTPFLRTLFPRLLFQQRQFIVQSCLPISHKISSCHEKCSQKISE